MAKNSGNYIPSRGDVVWVDFSPTQGHKQSHRRPTVVVSPVEYNKKSGLMIVCPITSKKKGYPFEIECVAGVILVDQIRCLDWISRGIVFKQQKVCEDSMQKLKHYVHLLVIE